MFQRSLLFLIAVLVSEAIAATSGSIPPSICPLGIRLATPSIEEEPAIPGANGDFKVIRAAMRFYRTSDGASSSSIGVIGIAVICDSL